ncbi:CDP-glucose 4,6-dehydratase [Candidatus Pelagibacter sp.]|nr:CDP-glucose 4,6-dehydratase [Candidatus Pelagibacter sp.]
MRNFFKNKKVFITGHTGFKGIWLVNILNFYKADVYGYSKNDKFKNNFAKLCNLNRKKSFYGNILDKNKLEKTLRKVSPNIVFHLAAQSIVKESYLKPCDTINTNVIGTMNLLEACRDVKTIKSIIIVTSDKCYENLNKKKSFSENNKLGGDDPYSASKAAAEIITNAYIKSFFNNNRIGIASVRAGNVIGGGDWSENRIIPDCARSIISKKKIYLRNPYSVRPWQHVIDVINGYLILSKKLYMAKSKKKYSGSWNFGPNEKMVINVKSLVNKFFKSIKIKKKLALNKKNLFKEKKILKLNSSKSFKKLKWKQKINSSKAIELSANWYLNYIKNKKNIIYQQIIDSKIFY